MHGVDNCQCVFKPAEVTSASSSLPRGAVCALHSFSLHVYRLVANSWNDNWGDKGV